MKISELNTNTFLNTTGAPENSYLLINYAAGQGVSAATQKVSLDTVAKAVAAKLNLPIAVTDNAGNVTGLRHVEAAGNTYSIQDLNASFGGGGGSADPTQGMEVIGPHIEGSETFMNEYASQATTVYPVYCLPNLEMSEAILFTVTESDSVYYANYGKWMRSWTAVGQNPEE